jgi:hypothetical protein
MKAKIFALIFFLILSFFVYKVYAQDTGLTSIMSQNKIRTCLAADPTITKTKNRACNSKDPKDEAECESKGKWLLGNATEMHLTGTCDAPNGCEIWHENGPREVNGLIAGFNKVVNHVAAGKVDVTVTGTFLSHVSHDFFAIGDAPLVAETGLGAAQGTNRTQQIGEVSNFAFTQVAGSQQSCTTIYWDPFGRVFDAVSLEPISGVKVSLFQNPSKQLVSVPTNPALTGKGGIYNILINKEDDYYLTVDAPSTHSFTKSTLNPKASLIYSHIYSPGVIFHEGPLPLSIPGDFDLGPYHHDIPLQPKGESYHNALAEVVEGSLNQADLGNFVNYWGQVTFPMAKVCLVGEKSGPIGCANADRYGNFEINVDKMLVPQEFMEIKVEKVNLTELTMRTVLDNVMSFFVKDVNAQNSIKIDSPTTTPKPKAGFNPILSYIEGYTYDQSASLIPLAKVSVKLKADDQVFYVTYADETGFFTIYSSNLPFFEYYLEIQTQDGHKIKQSTAEFINLNKDYLDKENLNLVTSIRAGKPIINPTTGQLNEKSALRNQAITPTSQPVKTSLFNPAAMLLLVVIFLLVAVTVGLVLYIKRSKSF